MIARLLSDAAASDPAAPFLIDRGRVWSRGESLAAVRTLAAALRQAGHRRLVAYLEDSADLVHLLLAAAESGVEIALANRLSPPSELAHYASTSGAEAVVVRMPESDFAGRQIRFDDLLGHGGGHQASAGAVDGTEPDATVVIFTTGTTGRPKGVRYRWENLVGQVRRRDDQHGSRWILLYQFNHFAGFQVLSHILGNDGSLVIPANRDVDEIRTAMARHAVTHVSATPTFWRLFTGQSAAPLPDVRQVTLGGEASTQDLLNRLRTLFPGAIVSQVYATTELGSCFSVTDGRCGFPASLLDDPDRPNALRIVDGELQIRPRSGMLGYTGASNGEHSSASDSTWVPTGDVVEQVEDRVYFRGRTSEVINVGGVKVHPLDIEAVIATVPGVRHVRVSGKPNPIMGSLVIADIVLEEEAPQADVEARIRQAAETWLSRYQQPRLLNFVPHLETVNQKLSRRQPSEPTS